MRYFALIISLMLALHPALGWGCACGCGVFDVQTGGMLPTKPGGLAFFEYDFMNQKQNRSGRSKAPAEDNSDQEIRTDFMTAGVEYMFSRSWGLLAEVPFWNRRFSTLDDNGDAQVFNHTALGDIRLRGVYSGFSPDMSSGLTFGVKLPSGDYTDPNFDRDTEIGTGSTDLLLGAYHMGGLGTDGRWAWFTNGLWDEPALTAAGYRPGAEVDAVLGGYYNDWRLGEAKIAPLAQVIGSNRWRDSGTAAHSGDTGYTRVLLSPGVELETARWRVYADVGFPVYQYYNGNQLVASEYFKASIGYSF